MMQAEEVRALINLIAENVSIVKDLHNNVLSHTNKGKAAIYLNLPLTKFIQCINLRVYLYS